MFKKILITVKEFKNTANYYYGKSPICYFKFIYYSLFSVNTFIVYVADLEKEVPSFPIGDEYRVLMPTRVELENLRKGKHYPREFYYDEIHNVKMCFLALKHNEPAYIHWVYFKGDFSRFLYISNYTAEINYITTLPEFRGDGLSTKILAYTLNYLKNTGIKKAVSVCHENNIPIIKSFLRSGFLEMQKIKSIGPFNKKITV